MKLIRFGEIGKEKPGVLINEKRYDVSSIVTDFNESFFEENGLEKLQKALENNPEVSGHKNIVIASQPTVENVITEVIKFYKRL